MRAGTISAAMALVAIATSTAAAQSFSSPIAVVAEDFNGDTKVDIAVADNDTPGDVTVLLGNGSGGFVGPGASFPVGMPQLSAPSALAAADLNGDGKLDLVVADEIGNSVSVLLNQPQTLFGSATIFDTGVSPESVVVGDFDGDGIPDIATADNFDDTVSVLQGHDGGQGKGDGTFVNRQPIAVGSEPQGLVAVDLDGDHNLDLVVTNESGGMACSNLATQACRMDSDCPTGGTCTAGTGSITILKGLGGATFQTLNEIAATCSNQPTMVCTRNADCPSGGTCTTIFNVPVAITATDLNGDMKPDLLVVNEQGGNDQGGTVTILLGNADFSFKAPTSAGVGNFPEGIVAADFNGDTKMDIATSNNFDDNVSVLIGLGNGSFMPRVDFPVGVSTAPWGIAAADFNNNTTLDLVTTNMEAGTVSVILDPGVQPTPTVGVSTPTPTPTPSCTGDCNSSMSVTVDELLTMVNIALGNADVSTCLAGDANHDTQITIDEILTAVSYALSGCPS